MNDYLRIRTHAKPDVPPVGAVDIVYDTTEGTLAMRDAEGGVTAIGGAVDNAAVNAAIETDAAATRESLGLGAAAVVDSTAAGEALMTAADAAAQRTAMDVSQKNAINPSSVPGMIAGYVVDQTTRTGSSINVWKDISGHGRDATFVSSKDTVAGTAPDEYAISGGLYTPSPTIPVDFTNHTMICIFGAGRINGRNAIESNSFALTDAAASGGGALVASGTLVFYNATRTGGCLRNRTGKNAITLRFGAGTCSARSNGITDKVAVNGAASVTNFAHIWGYNGAGGFGWHQERVALYFYNRVLSDAEVAGIEKWHGVDTPTGALHVIGDSFVDGTGATAAQNAYCRILESATGVPLCAHGGSGMTFAAMNSARLATSITSSVSAGLNPVVVLDLGKNTLAAGTTDASMRTTYTTFCNAITATGADLICVSIPPRTAGFSGGADSASYESNRLSFNAWLRTQEGTLFEKLADCGGDPRVGDVADLSGANYSGDGIHLSNAGHAIWAEIVLAAYNAL